MNRLTRLAIVSLASALSIAGSASADQAATTTYNRFHNVNITFSNAKVTATGSGSKIGNVAVVTPGAAITVEADFNFVFSNNSSDYSFCPSCFVQNYVAWAPAAAAAGASPINLGLWDGQSFGPGQVFTIEGSTSGHFVFNTNAPTTPGEYYIGCGETLDFGFVPGATGGPGFDPNVALTGPQTFNSFLISVVTVPPVACAGDADGNGVVNFADITNVLANFNTLCP